MNYDIKKLKQNVLENYKAEKYSPLGADGGCLKYIHTGCYLKDYTIRASITMDTEIAEVLPVIALSLIDKDGKYIDVLDFTKEYYQCRI